MGRRNKNKSACCLEGGLKVIERAKVFPLWKTLSGEIQRSGESWQISLRVYFSSFPLAKPFLRIPSSFEALSWIYYSPKWEARLVLGNRPLKCLTRIGKAEILILMNLPLMSLWRCSRINIPVKLTSIKQIMKTYISILQHIYSQPIANSARSLNKFCIEYLNGNTITFFPVQ